MQLVSSDSMQKVSEIDLKVGKCSDTRCGEPPAIHNENTKILEQKRDFINHEPLRGGNLL